MASQNVNLEKLAEAQEAADAAMEAATLAVEKVAEALAVAPGMSDGADGEPGGAMSDLYGDDILLWSEQQAELLRHRAAGELVNDAELDWLNIAEEIESVGSEQRHAVESLLINIMQHRLQIAAWPTAAAVAHWRHEIDGWCVQVERRLRRGPALRPAMEVQLADLYRDAVRSMYREVDGVPRPPVPDACPFTLTELLAEPEG